MNATEETSTAMTADEVTSAPKPKKAKAPKPKAAKKSKAKKPGHIKPSKGERLVPANLSKYRKTKSASGNASFHNGDRVAKMLDGKTVADVYAIVAKATKATEASLKNRFKHLNLGMQRMNLGNVLRAAL